MAVESPRSALHDEGVGTGQQRLAAAVLKRAVAVGDVCWLRSDAALWPWIALVTPRGEDAHAVQQALVDAAKR